MAALQTVKLNRKERAQGPKEMPKVRHSAIEVTSRRLCIVTPVRRQCRILLSTSKCSFPKFSLTQAAVCFRFLFSVVAGATTNQASEPFKQPAALTNAASLPTNFRPGDLTLDAIDLRVEPGQLVGVVGPVGSSKSSLLMAVLREIAPETTTTERNGIKSASLGASGAGVICGEVRT